MKIKNRLMMIVLIAIISLIGTTYAYFNYYNLGSDQIVVAGDLLLKLNEGTDNINLLNVFPETIEEARARTDNQITFTVSGVNTTINNDVYYGIVLNNGDDEEGKTRYNPWHLVFDLIEIDEDGNEIMVVDARRFTYVDKQMIWVNMISRNTSESVFRTYKLRMWLSEDVIISDTEDYADYTTSEFKNSYGSIKVSVEGDLTPKNIPLKVESDSTLVENNKAYFIATLSNTSSNQVIGNVTKDEIGLKVTGTNSEIVFSYKDSKGNVVEETSESLDLSYNLAKGESVEIQIFVIPKNDTNGVTNLNLKASKNGQIIQSFLKKMTIYGNNFCLNNGLNNLYDCILASDSLTTNVETAKVNIANKGEVNLNDTAPSYTYVEEITTNVSNAYTVPSGYKYYLSDSYEFNSTTGTFKLTGTIITDSLSDTYLNYYTCGGTSTGNSTCATIYKILGTDSENQKITLADKITYKIASSIRSEVGLYKTEDDFGDAYFYRGDVQNNNVYFAGFYWKIIRTNGDGTIRLIYQGTTPTATGTKTSINDKYGQYNKYYPDPTYVGYMYGNNFSETEVVSPELTDSSFVELTEYYFGDGYTYDETTKLYQLKQTSDGGNLKKGTLTAMQDEFGTYKYTCRGTSETSTCQYMILINSYRTATSIRGSHITYPITNLDDIYENNVSSMIKDNLETWYKTNIVDKMDSNGISYADYIANQRFCNERTFNYPTKLTSNGTINTAYSEYKISTTVTYSRYRTLYSDANKTASLKCNNISDSFSAKGTDSNKGNGLLEYPVGLITADEVALAGGKYNTKNLNYYLRTGGYFWTMTPSYFSVPNALALVWYVLPTGEVNPWSHVTLSGGVRAVINLDSDLLISQGDGTENNPYVVSLSK